MAWIDGVVGTLWLLKTEQSSKTQKAGSNLLKTTANLSRESSVIIEIAKVFRKTGDLPVCCSKDFARKWRCFQSTLVRL